MPLRGTEGASVEGTYDLWGQRSSKCEDTWKRLFYLFVYFWLGWVFVAACKLSLVAESGGSLSSCGVWASRGSGFSCWRAYALGCIRFSSCDTWAQQLCTGLVAPCHPGPEIELESPALAGWFLTTGPRCMETLKNPLKGNGDSDFFGGVAAIETCSPLVMEKEEGVDHSWVVGRRKKLLEAWAEQLVSGLLLQYRSGGNG